MSSGQPAVTVLVISGNRHQHLQWCEKHGVTPEHRGVVHVNRPRKLRGKIRRPVIIAPTGEWWENRVILEEPDLISRHLAREATHIALTADEGVDLAAEMLELRRGAGIPTTTPHLQGLKKLLQVEIGRTGPVSATSHATLPASGRKLGMLGFHASVGWRSGPSWPEKMVQTYSFSPGHEAEYRRVTYSNLINLLNPGQRPSGAGTWKQYAQMKQRRGRIGRSAEEAPEADAELPEWLEEDDGS